MAFLMFFTSIGFSMDIHYCQGHLKSISLLGKAKNCHDIQAMKSDHCKKTKTSCNHGTDKISQKEAEGCLVLPLVRGRGTNSTELHGHRDPLLFGCGSQILKQERCYLGCGQEEGLKIQG